MTQEEYKKNIENRKKTAVHLDAAEKYHLKAVRFSEVGNEEKANQNNIKSKEYLRLASEDIIEAVYGKPLNNYGLIYQPF